MIQVFGNVKRGETRQYHSAKFHLTPSLLYECTENIRRIVLFGLLKAILICYNAIINEFFLDVFSEQKGEFNE